MFLYRNKIHVWLFIVGAVYAAPSDDLQTILEEGELPLNAETYIKYIVPSGYFPQKTQKPSKLQLKDLVDEENEYYQILDKHIKAGHAMKGLTFNIYDDNIRETTIALFKLLQDAKDNQFTLLTNWAFKNINKDIANYAYRLALLRKDYVVKQNEPPFISKPNFFVNYETINKALKLKLNNGKVDEQEAIVNQVYMSDNIITINSNYSGWNQRNSECEYLLDYFREDIALNSYYYGVQLMYPFWMSNDELTETDPRYAENYYYIHQQLIARYKLENEHLKYANHNGLDSCYNEFSPYLMYENGLAFPSRSNVVNVGWNDEQARLKSIDIAIKECLARGFIYMDNGTKVELTEDNYVDLLAKLVRANYEGIKTSKIVKSLYGYGGNGYPLNRYNPAPSVLHQPETTLRDPIYWYLIESLLKYFNEYAATLEPYDFSKYQNDMFEIIDYSFSKLTTYYDYFEFNINKIFGDSDYNVTRSSLIFNVRQKRLKHLPFNLDFSVISFVNRTGTAKLFLGPQCNGEDCWRVRTQFFEIDTFDFYFEEGLNIVSWTPDKSNRFSFDDSFNFDSSMKNKFDLRKFPESMLLPKGLEQGLNLTLFILITASTDASSANDLEPVGYPFHRQILKLNDNLHRNYNFFNVTIFHKEGKKDPLGQFSAHLN